ARGVEEDRRLHLDRALPEPDRSIKAFVSLGLAGRGGGEVLAQQGATPRSSSGRPRRHLCRLSSAYRRRRSRLRHDRPPAGTRRPARRAPGGSIPPLKGEGGERSTPSGVNAKQSKNFESKNFNVIGISSENFD